MKKFFVSLSAILLTASIFSSCSNDDDPQPNNNVLISSGTWVVHLYTDSGNDETSDYSGYEFVFASNGNMTATKAGVITAGTWGTRTDDGKNKMDINLNTTNADLLELNDDWIIKSITASLIELQDDNTASGEVLHFMKK
ncbi:hypothetical protein ACFSQD_00165 [Flavihumibacter stibioxidans]|uniref:Lipocalin-like domain-containing protein n=1 Tax=Flavihumibacter stibioxidans TaxID=1834163 RepID=A0ABR7MDK3_9BACT|nr:hypothetical protein [Flavihumibacter stibioxidans]MBC6492914.1 hypothetical protein [Flavihumibacter stibioxidans]